MEVKRKLILALVTLAIVLSLIFFSVNQLKYNNITYETKELYNYFGNYDFFVTDEVEVNTDLVSYITKGMSENDFKSIFHKTGNYILSTNPYKQVNYNFDKHLTYEKLEKIYLLLNNSDIVNIEILGQSYDGRNIYSIEIGKGNNVTMLEGNIHAAEIAPTLYLTKFAVNLVNRYENNDEEIITLLNNHKIVIVPSANPDGYDYAIFGKEMIRNKKAFAYVNDYNIDPYYYKANINGIDLNRNFPSQLGGLYFKTNKLSSYTSLVKSTEFYKYFPGYTLGSESETKALMYWIYKYYKNANAFLSLHSAGRVIYDEQQYLSDTFNDEGKKCAEIVEKYTKYKIVGVDYEDGYGTDGNSTDFIEELAHGYTYSKSTGRLSTYSYGEKVDIMTQKMCVLTIETLESYTQDINIIKNEWFDKKLEYALIDIIKR